MKEFLEKMTNHIYDNSPKKENVVKVLSGVSLVYGLSLLYYHRQAIGNNISDILSTWNNKSLEKVDENLNTEIQSSILSDNNESDDEKSVNEELDNQDSDKDDSGKNTDSDEIVL